MNSIDLDELMQRKPATIAEVAELLNGLSKESAGCALDAICEGDGSAEEYHATRSQVWAAASGMVHDFAARCDKEAKVG